MKRQALVWTLLALASLTFAACGGEDALTEEEFVAQANEICAAGNERVDAAAEDVFGDIASGEEPSQEQLQEFLDTFTDDIEGQIDDIEALSPPDDMADDVDAFLEAASDKLTEVRDAGPEVLLSEEDPFAEVSIMAEDLGLTECGGE